MQIKKYNLDQAKIILGQKTESTSAFMCWPCMIDMTHIKWAIINIINMAEDPLAPND